MKVKNVIFRENSFGITQKSLKILRNTLTFCVNHPVAVVELPTNDLCCAFSSLINTQNWQSSRGTASGKTGQEREALDTTQQRLFLVFLASAALFGMKSTLMKSTKGKQRLLGHDF